jgi:hypothetical protein
MKKLIFFIILLMINVFIIFPEENPLLIDININDEIWLNGQIVIFNGWHPNIRMVVYDNKIIGIKDENIPEIIFENMLYNTIKGLFRLRFLHTSNIPYYDIPLLVFEIIEYKNIEIINK